MKINKILFALLTLVILSGIASALQVSSVTIGDDKEDRVGNLSNTFTITNNGTVQVEIISITSNAEAKYEISFTNKPTNPLAPGASATVTINAKIPLDFNAVDKITLEEKAFKIGEISVKGTTTGNTSISITETSDINMQAVNQLEIKKVMVSCGSKDERLDDGERMEELKPDTNDCSFSVEVENNFRTSDKNNQKIGDIEFDPATIEVESDNSNIDLDEEGDISGFDAGDEEEVTFDFDIAEEADDGTYTITIRAFGTDENGAFHGEKWEVKLEVERLKHDIQFQKVSTTPTEIETCGEKSVKVSATILNMGRRDEDEVAIELKIPGLKYSKKIENIELDRDDKTTINFDVSLPVNIKEGIYRGTLKTFFDNIAESSSKTIEISIIKCAIEEQPEEKEEEKEQQTTVIIPQQTQQLIPPIVTQAKTTKETQQKFTESTAYVGLLIGLLSLLFIAIIILMVVFFVKKKK